MSEREPPLLCKPLPACIFLFISFSPYVLTLSEAGIEKKGRVAAVEVNSLSCVWPLAKFSCQKSGLNIFYVRERKSRYNCALLNSFSKGFILRFWPVPRELFREYTPKVFFAKFLFRREEM